MSAILVLIGFSLAVALFFLGAFIWDSQTPSYILGPDMICCMTPAGEPLSNPSINEIFNSEGAFEIAVFTITAAEAMQAFAEAVEGIVGADNVKRIPTE